MGVSLAEIRGLQQKIATKGTDNITEIAIAGIFAIFAEFKNEIEENSKQVLHHCKVCVVFTRCH